MISISSLSRDAHPSDIIRLAPDGTLSTADGSSLQERLAELYRLWTVRDSTIGGLQSVNIVHRRHLSELWEMAAWAKKHFPEAGESSNRIYP